MEEVILGLGVIFAILLGMIGHSVHLITIHLKEIKKLNEDQIKKTDQVYRSVNKLIEVQKEYNNRTK